MNQGLPPCAGLLLLVSWIRVASADDWPQWRGPKRDGVASTAKLPARLPKSLTTEWRVKVGEGASSPIVVGDKIFLHTRERPDEEVVLCLNLADGREVWRSAYPAPYKLGGPAHGYEGPRSTPAFANGRLFTFGISGILSCFDTKGTLLWRKDFVDQYPATAPGWGTSASPLIDGDSCILHVGGPDKGALTAFDVKNGDVQWHYTGDCPSYGSPIIVDLAGERQVVTLGLNDLFGVSRAKGTLLWKIPCREIHSENCLTPILYKDLLIFSGRKEAARAIRLERDGNTIKPKEIWRNETAALYMSTPIVSGNRMFGSSVKEFGFFFCLDADSGKLLWRGEGRLQAGTSILDAGSAWIVLTSHGQILAVRPNAEKYDVIQEYRLEDGAPMWAHPAMIGNRLIVRDRTTLRSLRFDPM